MGDKVIILGIEIRESICNKLMQMLEIESIGELRTFINDKVIENIEEMILELEDEKVQY